MAGGAWQHMGKARVCVCLRGPPSFHLNVHVQNKISIVTAVRTCCDIWLPSATRGFLKFEDEAALGAGRTNERCYKVNAPVWRSYSTTWIRQLQRGY